MNREQRRAMARALKARGRELVVLRGGPMDGWTVAPGAAVLEPGWRADYLEAAAEGLYLEARERGDSTAWTALTAEQRTPYRVLATRVHGAGRYEHRPAEALAVWRAG